MKIFIALISFVIIQFVSYAQVYPTINESRNRIYISNARFSWLKNNYTTGQAGQTYNSFRNAYNNNWITVSYTYLVGNDSAQWNYIFRRFSGSESAYRRDIVWTAIYSAFLWRINSDNVMLNRCSFITTRLINAINNYPYDSCSSDDKEAVFRDFGQIGGIFLDWCYDGLAPNQLNDLAKALYKLNRNFVNTFITSSAGNSYVSSHNALNSIFTLQNSFSLYNSVGLTQNEKDTVVVWYHILYDKWMNNFLPVRAYYANDDGGWNWGAAYIFWSLYDNTTLYDDILIATGKNLYVDMPWIKDNINNFYYMLRPDFKCIHLGDGETNIGSYQTVYRNAEIYGDNKCRWLSQIISTSGFMTWTMPLFEQLAFRDYTAPVVSHPMPQLDWFSDKVGLVSSRSGWDSNAVQYWFFNSPSKRASHEHRDNNSFGIYFKNPLVVDAGYYDSYGSQHFMNYYTRTIAHNSICIFDPNESYYYGTSLVSNDGGQVYSNPLMNMNDILSPGFQRGKWIVYSSGSNYVYCNSDATLSYYPSKVNKYIRKMLYLKPDKFITLDYVQLVPQFGANREIRWIAHFPNQPLPAGSLQESIVPGHLEVFKGGDYTMSYKQSNVSIRTLMPDSVYVRRVGGSGFEYWVNGVNYPPSTNPDSNFFTPGKWRIEVYPKIPKDTMLLIHTISAGSVFIPSSPVGILHKSSQTAAVELDNNLYAFSSTPDTGISVQSIPDVFGGRIINLWAADLKRNIGYKILIDSVFYENVISDSTGIALFSVNLNNPGPHTIEIIESFIISVNNHQINFPQKFSLYQNYANPFNPTTKIKFDVPFAGNGRDRSVRLIIYDALGREVQTLVNETLQPGTYEVEFNGADYSSGVYYYTFSSGNYFETKKMIILK